MDKKPRGMSEAPREFSLEDTALQIRKIGNSVGVILPKELLAKLGVGKGDTVYAIEQPDDVRLTTADPEFAARFEVARQTMKKRRAVLRELAK